MRVVFGLRDLFSGRRRKAAQARKQELGGDLRGAAALYAEAELPDDAARVLLLQADAEPTPEQRLLLCAQAARLGGGTAHGQQARRRKALLSFDVARATSGGALPTEVLAIARELEACGEWRKAAEAYALVDDTENEIRVLEEAGAIDLLEGRLREEQSQDRLERRRRQLLTRMTDLDRVAERREALRIGGQWLDAQQDDAVELEVDRIRGRLLQGPNVQLEVDGEVRRFALGTEVTIGRSNATILVQSQAISREHLRLFRRDGAAWVEDLDTRNGTLLGGARLEAPLPVGSGITVELAGQVTCRLAPAEPDDPTSPLHAEVAGSRLTLPLGPLSVGRWVLKDRTDGDDRFVEVHTPPGQEPPYLDGLRLVRQVQLCVGDALREEREGAVVLRVPDQFRA